MQNIDVSAKPASEKKSKKVGDNSYPIKNEVSIGMVFIMTFFLISYAFHCTWVSLYGSLYLKL